ncbi:hypothetical protein AAHA92_09328 [Salvia divinorum]|uniref:Uncharacterized protein n=1 Tax=Salvia divinorum TaxID=28513 RepID=A0ABD1HUI4_SALDI
MLLSEKQKKWAPLPLPFPLPLLHSSQLHTFTALPNYHPLPTPTSSSPHLRVLPRRRSPPYLWRPNRRSSPSRLHLSHCFFSLEGDEDDIMGINDDEIDLSRFGEDGNTSSINDEFNDLSCLNLEVGNESD